MTEGKRREGPGSATCATHGGRLHWLDHGSLPVCPQCRAAAASAERIEAARSTHARVDSILGFGWRPRRQPADWNVAA